MDTAIIPNTQTQNGKMPNNFSVVSNVYVDHTDSLDSNLSRFFLDDIGNAQRFVARFGRDTRYCPQLKSWLVWDGHRWLMDTCGAAMELAKLTARAIFREASKNVKDQKELSGWANRSSNKDRLSTMLSTAATDPRVVVELNRLDADPFLLNVLNGTIDLTSGHFREARREDLMTMTANVVYDAAAAAPTWTGFLDRVLPFNDPGDDVRAYVQQAAGYSLTGDVSTHALFFLYGSGANGKSTFLRTLQKLMGDYGKEAAPDLLVAKDTHPTGIAHLRGSRLVSTVEVEDGKRFSEVQLKRITGGDTLTARKMHCDFTSFDATFKIFMAGNHKPVVHGTDDGVWRRLKLIHFMVKIPPSEMDSQLADKLYAEFPGILNWMIEGCNSWFAGGKRLMAEPRSVVNATTEYRESEDVIGQCIDECCVLEIGAAVQKILLHDMYNAWSLAKKEEALSFSRFNKLIVSRGFSSTDRNTKGQAIWKGIGLLVADDGPVTEATEANGGLLPKSQGKLLTRDDLPNSASNASVASVSPYNPPTPKEYDAQYRESYVQPDAEADDLVLV